MISPIVAGKRIDFPESPALCMLHIIFPVAINAITAIPNNKLLFQNATPNNMNDTGTANNSNSLDTFHFPVSHSFSNCKNVSTSSLTTVGLGNQNMLVNKQKSVMTIPSLFF